jgi:hypothetical protein
MKEVTETCENCGERLKMRAGEIEAELVCSNPHCTTFGMTRQTASLPL